MEQHYNNNNNNNKQPQSTLFFDPDEHTDYTLKAFNDFIDLFELRYNAQFPDPPKLSLDAALMRWKITNTTEDQPNPKPHFFNDTNFTLKFPSSSGRAVYRDVEVVEWSFRIWLLLRRSTFPPSDT